MPRPIRYQSRRWCFTLFDERAPDLSPKVSYLIYGRETCPKSGRLHWQCYAEFHDKVTTAHIQKHMCRGIKCHTEAAEGTPTDNYNYCRKINQKPEVPANEVWHEHGTMMEYQPGKRTDLERVRDAIYDGATYDEIIYNHPSVGSRCPRWVEEIIRITEPERDWETECILLWGPTGTGKTRFCHEQGAKRVAFNGRFYAGYRGEPVVYFDEVPLQRWPRDEFLRMTDRYPHEVEVKNGWRNWCPRVIYFTMNEDPTPLLEADEALARRFTEVRYVG